MVDGWRKDAEIEEKLKDLIRMRKEYNEELAESRQGYMIKSCTPKGTFTYSEVRKVGDRTVHRGITKDKEAIRSHGRKRYLQQQLKNLEVNIHGLEYLLQIYRPMDAAEVIRSLPKAYEDLPAEMFLSAHGRTKWEEEDYPTNSAYPENLRHITLRGFKVRSKSELYIACQLDRYEIPYRYEMEINLGNLHYYPDFVIRNPFNGRLTYWEHCGMVANEQYMSSHYEKMKTYAKYGIVPWKNLIVTYDDEDGNLSAKDIDHAIKGLLAGWNNEGTGLSDF